MSFCFSRPAPEMEVAAPSVDVQAAAAENSLSGEKKTNSKPVWVLLEEAAQMKTEGNAFYREKKIRSAIGRYHRALLVLRTLDADVNTSVKGFGPETPDLTSEQEAKLRNIQVDCYNNLAGKTFKYCLCTWWRIEYWCLSKKIAWESINQE